MPDVTKEMVLERLRSVRGPDMEGNIVDLGMVSDVFISDGKAYFSITVPAERAKELEPMRAAAERVVREIPGVKAAMVALTADRKAAPQAGPVERPRPAPPSGQSHGHRPASGMPAKTSIPGVGAIIAVASGKGGVGKSTTSVNLALALKANGLKVGLLDADIYGPSMPRLLKIYGRPQQIEGRLIRPMENYGLKVMSMGFLVDEEVAMIWRGPMIQSALLQMLREVAWGELDVLVVDMPPGTGDAHLTLTQSVPIDGAVIVTTPQEIALIDAKKGLKMFDKVGARILGIVENMGTFVCPDCGAEHPIFAEGGGRATAERFDVPFLGTIPLHGDVTPSGDEGLPIVRARPDSGIAERFREIARRVIAAVE